MIDANILRSILKEKKTIKEIHINPNNDILYRTEKQKPYYWMNGFIGIYELENKCHEWALKKGYCILIDRFDKKFTNLTIRDNKTMEYIMSELYKNEKSYNIVFEACKFIYYIKKRGELTPPKITA